MKQKYYLIFGIVAIIIVVSLILISSYIQQPTNCAKEGEVPTDFDFTSGKPVPGGKPCCEGLKAIGPRTDDELLKQGICAESVGGPGTCRPCGDDVCNPDYEDKCNCPEDCK